MIVVKVGGGEGIDRDAVCDDIANLHQQGEQVILVHGGNHLTNHVATELGHPPQFVTSSAGFTSRLTDRRTMEIFEMVYCGLINKGIVERLQQQGVNAMGFSGIDGGLWRGPRKKAIRVVENGRQRIIRDTYTGRVDEVNVGMLEMLLDGGYVPVLTPPALSLEGEAINVDGDRAAAATAAAINASHFLILSDIPGVLRHYPDVTSLIPTIHASDLQQISETVAQGRMHIKLLSASEALEGGVNQVVIGSANVEQPIQAALAGQGTVIHPEGHYVPQPVH